MDLSYSREEIAFRDEVRAWLAENLPKDLQQKVVNFEELTKDEVLRWHRILAKKGWIAPLWRATPSGSGICAARLLKLFIDLTRPASRSFP